MIWMKNTLVAAITVVVSRHIVEGLTEKLVGLEIEERGHQRLRSRKNNLATNAAFNQQNFLSKRENQNRRGLTFDFNNDDKGPDFAPPNPGRPSVDYGGRHPFEDNFDPSTECYDPLRISFVTDNLEELEATSFNDALSARINAVTDSILPAVSKLWSEALSVTPVSGNIFHTQDTCGGAEVPNSFKTEGLSDTDLIIYVLGRRDGDDGCDESTLAYGGPCEYDQFTRPIAGRIVLCIDKIEIDSSNTISLDEIQQNVDVLVHEVGHVLGISSGMFEYYRNHENGDEWPSTLQEDVKCVDGTTRDIVVPSILQQGFIGDRPFFEIVSPTVLQVAKNQFNCQRLSGARLENQPTTSTCFGYHWDERFFLNERMSSVTTSRGQNLLSSMTLALLEDTGWYKADFSKASNSPFGHGVGCSFVEEDCINDGKIPSQSKGFFCNDVIPWSSPFVGDSSKVKYGCEPSHFQKAACDLVDYGDPILGLSERPPQEYQYFPNKDYGAFYLNQADYCPVKILYAMNCLDESNTPSFPGETFGDDARCFETDQRKSVCLETHCNEIENRVEIIIDGQSFPCYDGQKIQPLNLPYQIECPRLAAICPNMMCPSNCSGRGVCDFSLESPKCICNDPNDDTPGCWGSQTSCPTRMPEVTASPSFSPIPSSSPSNTPTKPADGRDGDESSSPSLTSLPSIEPSLNPTLTPSMSQTSMPSPNPSSTQSLIPSLNATLTPTENLTSSLSPIPSPSPSITPTKPAGGRDGDDDYFPSLSPSHVDSSLSPSHVDSSLSPSYVDSSLSPSHVDSTFSPYLTPLPSIEPSLNPTLTPTLTPTSTKSDDVTLTPSLNATLTPTENLTSSLSPIPSPYPSITPTRPAGGRDGDDDYFPSFSPSLTSLPSIKPSFSPTLTPTVTPTLSPTLTPTLIQSDALTSIPTLTPTENPTSTPGTTPMPTFECYRNWDELKNDIESSKGGEFTICDNTIFSLDQNSSPITFSSFQYIIKCGKDGRKEDNCIIQGGSSHFKVVSPASTLMADGLTMKNATDTSVLGWGGDGALASFNDCSWEGNTGLWGAAVDVWTRGFKAMEVVFNRCSFIENTSDKGALNVEGGRATVEDCTFVRNRNDSTKRSSGSAISVKKNAGIGSTLILALSKFYYNVAANGKCTIFVEIGSLLIIDLDNVGEGNVASCVGVYKESSHECTNLAHEH